MKNDTEVSGKRAGKPGIARNRAFIGGACIAAALAVVACVPAVQNQTTPEVTVVEAKADIAQGAQLTASNLAEKTMRKADVPSGAVTIKEAENVVNRYAAYPMLKGDILTMEKVSQQSTAYNLASGQMLISVPIKSFADGLSAKLEPGDIVSVFTPASQNTATGSSTGGTASGSTAGVKTSALAITPAVNPRELQYVKVVAVTTATGKDADTKKIEAPATTSSSSNSTSELPSTVTLSVSRRQAEILTALDSSNIHFALVSRGNAALASQLLSEQAQTLKEADGNE